MNAPQNQNRKWFIFLLANLGLALALGLLSVTAGLGSRWEWWNFRQGFKILTFGFYGAIFSFFLTLIVLIIGKSGTFQQKLVWGIPPLVLSLILIILPLSWIRTAKQVPRIHDITTDTDTPPVFVAVLPLRKGALNPADYGGKEVADKQKTGYPDLRSERVSLDADQTFQRALQTAKEMGWKIVADDPSQRRIEATDTTFWFGFKDDIVIRVLPEDGSSRLDIRSLSRVGLSDVGTNAKRIRKFLSRFRKSVSSS